MMKMNSTKKMLSIIVMFVLIAAMALNITGCGSKNESTASNASAPAKSGEIVTVGTGSKTFTFIAVDLEGVESQFEVHTDADTVGSALVENGLISGEEGDYGLYVNTVNGIALDWDKDAKYWSFLIDGEYAMTGCDMTEITEGCVYTFVPAE